MERTATGRRMWGPATASSGEGGAGLDLDPELDRGGSERVGEWGVGGGVGLTGWGDKEMEWAGL